jgi:hypothetical protein
MHRRLPGEDSAMRRFGILVAPVLAVGAQAAEPYLSDLLKQRPYRASWEALLRTEGALPDWVVRYRRTLNGVATPSRAVRLNGIDYRLASICKPHDCYGNELHVLFGPGGRGAWAMLKVHGEKRWLGHPDEQIQAAITRASQQ